jgi:ribosomal protein S27E
MSTVTALRKHPCPECGGDAEWNAQKQALSCPYCGTTMPWQPGQEATGAEIKEHDLVQALRQVPDRFRGWQEEKTTVKCQSCQAISVFDAARQAQRCDFCASPSLVAYVGDKDAITPESVLPFKLSEPQTRDLLRRWYESRWFAPDRLKKAALTDTLHGIYVPYWTFDAHVTSDWQALSGYHYYETETFEDQNGQIQRRQVQHTRWQPSAGRAEHLFDDALVPGTGGIDHGFLAQIEPFPTTTDELKAYDPAFVRGWTVERYQVDLRAAADTSRALMDATMERLCSSQVPGDTFRDLQLRSQYDERTFKHVLVPIWVVTYTFGARSFKIIVNGHSGEIAGDHPRSWVKIFLYIILPLMILMGLLLSAQ